MLGQLDAENEERLELRLLTDAAFIEEFDTIVDEITDEYVRNELQATEREQVERHFLKSTERQNKMRFAAELLKQAGTGRDGKVADTSIQSKVTAKPGIFERLRSFWRNQSFAPRLATTMAAILVLVGVGYLIRPGAPTPGNYATINLTIGAADRNTGAITKTVKREPGTDGFRFELTLPEQMPQAQSYQVELLDEQQSPRILPITQGTARSFIVEVPANEITRGTYIINIYALNPDGSRRRIPGGYHFAVE